MKCFLRIPSVVPNLPLLVPTLKRFLKLRMSFHVSEMQGEFPPITAALLPLSCTCCKPEEQAGTCQAATLGVLGLSCVPLVCLWCQTHCSVCTAWSLTCFSREMLYRWMMISHPLTCHSIPLTLRAQNPPRGKKVSQVGASVCDSNRCKLCSDRSLESRVYVLPFCCALVLHHPGISNKSSEIIPTLWELFHWCPQERGRRVLLHQLLTFAEIPVLT